MVLRGVEVEHAKKGVIAKKEAMNKNICFHSKTVLLVIFILSFIAFFFNLLSRIDIFIYVFHNELEEKKKTIHTI